MDKTIDSTKFARSVVSGNPVAGDTPEEKAKNALDLYLAAKKKVQDRNKKISDKSLKDAGHL